MSDRKCERCSGNKTVTVTETRTEPDTTMGLALGAAIGMGYFPATKTVTETHQETCPRCHGTGKVAA